MAAAPVDPNDDDDGGNAVDDALLVLDKDGVDIINGCPEGGKGDDVLDRSYDGIPANCAILLL
jgi:hypothetical protein